MILSNSIIILDETLRKNEIRIIKSREFFGFSIENNTGEPLYFQIKYKDNSTTIDTVIITK